MIEERHLIKRYVNAVAVDDVSFGVQPGRHRDAWLEVGPDQPGMLNSDIRQPASTKETT